jgi:VCBS repeat-containing protein
MSFSYDYTGYGTTVDQGTLASSYTNALSAYLQTAEGADFVAFLAYVATGSVDAALALKAEVEGGNFSLSGLFAAAQTKIANDSGEVLNADPTPTLTVTVGETPYTIDLTSMLGGLATETWETLVKKATIYHTREFYSNSQEPSDYTEGWSETNQAPEVSGPVTQTIDEDDAAAAATVNLLANAIDPDGDDLDVSTVAYTVSYGTWDAEVAFDVDPETGLLSINPAQFNSLKETDSIALTFTYNVVDGNGGITPATAVITITGSNDAPTLSATIAPVAVTEAIDASAQSLEAITGSFTVNDADIGDTLAASVVGAAVVKLDGADFTLPGGAVALTAVGAFTLTGTTSNGGDASISYTYDPAAANLDFLRADQSLTITYTVQVNDGTANSGTQAVTFTITGTNDAPTATAITQPVTEYNEHVANPVIGPVYQTVDLLSTADDLDEGDTLSIAAGSVTLSNGEALPSYMSVDYSTGILSIDTNSAEFDSLYDGDPMNVDLTYQITDGTYTIPNTVDLTITGTADQFSGATTITVAKGDAVADSGSYTLQGEDWSNVVVDVTGYGDYDRTNEGFTVTLDVDSTHAGTTSTGANPEVFFSVNPGQTLDANWSDDGDLDYSVTFTPQTDGYAINDTDASQVEISLTYDYWM